MTKRFVSVALAAALAISAAAPAVAQGITIGRDGIRMDDGRQEQRRERRAEVSEREAVSIARDEGVREVDDVMRTRRAWRVEGADRRGRDITVDVDRVSGDVIAVR